MEKKQPPEGRESDRLPSLYDPRFERDACGIGFVANLNGNKNHQTVSDALTILENMEHRGACGAELAELTPNAEGALAAAAGGALATPPPPAPADADARGEGGARL